MGIQLFNRSNECDLRLAVFYVLWPNEQKYFMMKIHPAILADHLHLYQNFMALFRVEVFDYCQKLWK